MGKRQRRRLREAEFSTTATLDRPSLEAAATSDALTAATLPPGEVPFTAVLAIEGEETGDRRIIMPGALTWRDLPLPLLCQDELPETGGHAGAWAAGRIDTITRDGNRIVATGVYPDTEDGREAAQLCADQIVAGVSVDLDEVTAELELPDEVDDVEWEPGAVVPVDGPELTPLLRVTAARIMGATQTPHPAIPGAVITVDVEEEAPDGESPAAPLMPVLLAASAPPAPPAAWFDDPHLDGPTPLTVGDDGRVAGHLALWGSCHIGHPDMCLTVDPSPSGYAYFLTGELISADGARIPVGQLTAGCGHAPLTLAARQAAGHYDDTGWAWADVRVGDDDHGVWVAGAARPLDADQLRTVRAAALSGDWRRIGGSLELVAALSVNVPGFPVPRRVEARVASGECQALVASAAPRPPTVEERLARLEAHLGLARRAVVAAGHHPTTLGPKATALAVERLTVRLNGA